MRNARSLALFEATLSVAQIEQKYSVSPSDQAQSAGRYLTSGLLVGMKETERRIRLQNQAQRRKASRSLFQKAVAKPRENAQHDAAAARRARKFAMQIRIDAKRQDDFENPIFDEVDWEKFEAMTGMAPW